MIKVSRSGYGGGQPGHTIAGGHRQSLGRGGNRIRRRHMHHGGAECALVGVLVAGCRLHRVTDPGNPDPFLPGQGGFEPGIIAAGGFPDLELMLGKVACHTRGNRRHDARCAIAIGGAGHGQAQGDRRRGRVKRPGDAGVKIRDCEPQVRGRGGQPGAPAGRAVHHKTAPRLIVHIRQQTPDDQ